MCSSNSVNNSIHLDTPSKEDNMNNMHRMAKKQLMNDNLFPTGNPIRET